MGILIWSPRLRLHFFVLLWISLGLSEISAQRYTGERDYHFESGGAKAGAKIYTDRDFVYQLIPNSLVGYDYVQVPIEDRFTNPQRGLVELTLSRPTTVYIGFDSRASEIPEWIKYWEKTGDVATAAGHLTMEFYACEILSEGVLVLNGARAHKAEAMYVIFAPAGSIAEVKRIGGRD